MKTLLAVTCLLLCTGIAAQTQDITQVCEGDDCVQVGTNDGTIEIDGGQLQIAINNGVVNVT